MKQLFSSHRGFRLRQLPETHIERPAASIAALLLLLATFITGSAVYFLFKLAGRDDLQNEYLYTFPFILFGTVIGVYGLAAVLKKREVHVTKETVTVRKSGLFGSSQWQEPLNKFTGVLQRTETRQRSSSSGTASGYVVFVLELVHPNPKKSVWLSETGRKDGFRQQWEATARLLKLPALETSADGVIQREFDDLDKTLRQLIDEDKVEASSDFSWDPPAGIEVDRREGVVMLRLPKKTPPIAIVIIALAFPWIFIYLGFFHDKPMLVFGIAGIVVEIVVALGLLLNHITTQRIEITEDCVRQISETPFGQFVLCSIKCDAIEGMKIDRLPDQASAGLVISTDDQSEQVGTGLDNESLKWLHGCVVDVVGCSTVKR